MTFVPADTKPMRDSQVKASAGVVPAGAPEVPVSVTPAAGPLIVTFLLKIKCASALAPTRQVDDVHAREIDGGDVRGEADDGSRRSVGQDVAERARDGRLGRVP